MNSRLRVRADPGSAALPARVCRNSSLKQPRPAARRQSVRQVPRITRGG